MIGCCLIGVAAFSCVGRLAPRTSSYPDSWDETQRPLCLACVTAATGESPSSVAEPQGTTSPRELLRRVDVPSNRRVGLRLTSCSYGLDSPDRKFFADIHHAFGNRNQNMELRVEELVN